MSEGIGSYLRGLRTQQGLTTTQVAQKAGIRRATLSEWQSGKCQPRLPELDAVLNALQATETQKRAAREQLQSSATILQLREQTIARHQEWVDIAGVAPNGGDLLRAMRLRKGWTQAALATQMGVSQATVVRWERAERWPDTVSMHTLCYLLDAREEELTALTLGRWSLVEGEPPLDKDALWAQRYHIFATRYSPSEYALAELRLLSLIAHSWSLATRCPSGRLMLAEMLTEYSGYLFMHYRFHEAYRMAARAVDIYSTLGWKDSWTDTAIIRQAESLACRGSRQGAISAIVLLQNWLPEATEAIYTGWILCALAKINLAQGEKDAAVELGKKAVKHTKGTVNIDDYLYRRHDLARILIEAGRPQEAQELLSRTTLHPFFTLVRAEVYQAMGEQTAACQLLQEINAAMEEAIHVSQPEIAFYRPVVENLAEQWQVA